jgi:hypothetical protein
MKTIKIILVILVTGTIGFFAVRGLVNIGGVDKLTPPENQFTMRVEREIDSLSKLPDDRFCGEFHKEIKYHIDDYYKSKRLGNDESENEQWKDILSKNLYSAYSGKFIKQAFHVFRSTDWDFADMRFIRAEYPTLKNSPLLEKGSPVDQEFTKIQQIFSKYDEIVGFIANCRSFSCSSYGLSDLFPISDVKNKISIANEYRNHNLENSYVNHCTRLHNELKEIPQVLFLSHVSYLNRKIQNWSGFYNNYSTQSDYANNLYNPLKKEIDMLDNDIYRVPNFDGAYNRLLKQLENDGNNAYNYFSPPTN